MYSLENALTCHSFIQELLHKDVTKAQMDKGKM